MIHPGFSIQGLKKSHWDMKNGRLGDVQRNKHPVNTLLKDGPREYILDGWRRDMDIYQYDDFRLFLKERTESALTLAVLQLALAGVGVAWIPQSLAAKEISYGNLTELGHLFGSAKLRIDAVRLSGEKSEAEQNVWAVIGAAANRHRVP